MKCDNCNTEITDEDFYGVAGEVICRTCFEEHGVETCPECGEYVYPGDINEEDNTCVECA